MTPKNKAATGGNPGAASKIPDRRHSTFLKLNWAILGILGKNTAENLSRLADAYEAFLMDHEALLEHGIRFLEGGDHEN
jgi:hypothetical protein